ncbi:hypothetical protein GMLC_02480 [Geomonas limicola]|uniref:DUF4239 domain-containing protein n=1 Tax=Geomonas limicola TaxID=2740186 RepID=A0A6V8N5U8_9BACT|nr:DUF4239 domain-containing protein [Geomonas limicola]GFO66669.1 hypothetical protein GMLC_02480 [Geomonas limicola]
MDQVYLALSTAAALFVGMLFCLEVGRRIGIAFLQHDPAANQGVSAIEGAVFGLLGLLIAFTFSGAASRFEDRRHLIGQEANCIGTAYLRLDLVPQDRQPELRDLMRRYLKLRTDTYRSPVSQWGPKLTEAGRLQGEIWDKAVRASHEPGVPSQTAMLLLPALNDMIDITTTRQVATQNHPPRIVFIMLCGLSLAGALLAGYGMACGKRRSLLHVVCFSAIISLTVYVILDLEFPRAGLIRIDSADQVMLDLANSMK